MKKTAYLIFVITVLFGSATGDVLASVGTRELSWEDLVEMVGGPEVVSDLGITTEDAASEAEE